MLLRLLFLFLIAYILISVVKAYLTRVKSSTDGSSDSRGRKSEEEMVLDP